MTTYRIEWTDDRFDGMAAGDRLDAVRTLIEHGILDLAGDGVAEVRICEVPVDEDELQRRYDAAAAAYDASDRRWEETRLEYLDLVTTEGSA